MKLVVSLGWLVLSRCGWVVGFPPPLNVDPTLQEQLQSGVKSVSAQIAKNTFMLVKKHSAWTDTHLGPSSFTRGDTRLLHQLRPSGWKATGMSVLRQSHHIGCSFRESCQTSAIFALAFVVPKTLRACFPQRLRKKLLPVNLMCLNLFKVYTPEFSV